MLPCVRGLEDKVLPWYSFVLAEACVVFRPLIVIGVMLIVLVKGPAACENWRHF